MHPLASVPHDPNRAYEVVNPHARNKAAQGKEQRNIRWPVQGCLGGGTIPDNAKAIQINPAGDYLYLASKIFAMQPFHLLPGEFGLRAHRVRKFETLLFHLL